MGFGDELKAAIIKEDAEQVTELLEDADVEARRDNGDTPLHTAAGWGTPEIVDELLDRGADIDAQNGAGQTPLHDALIQENWEIAELLLERGASVDIGDRHGNRPLSKAVYHGDREQLELLLEHGANPKHRNKHGNCLMDRIDGYPDEIEAMVREYAEQHEPSHSEPKVVGFEAGLERVDLAGDDEAVLDWLWENLVPLSGQADTVQGELLRAVEKLRSEAQRNGNGNWFEDYEQLVDFLEAHLVDEALFDEDRRQQISLELDRLRQHERPYVDDDLYDRLKAAVVTYCEANPELIENEIDDDLAI